MSGHLPLVFAPAELERTYFVGELWGYHHTDANVFNIVGWGESRLATTLPGPIQSLGSIGSVLELQVADAATKLVGAYVAGKLVFRVGDMICRTELFEIQQAVFSRNSGILESAMMRNKAAIISGCGSVGSMVALELARAGVGNFVLIDNDTLAYHNLCRHQCGIQDVGKFKVNAVCERILQINPEARVATYPCILEDVGKEVFDVHCSPGALIIGCADNREGDVYGSTIACAYKIPFVSVGFWERASVGEVFYTIPMEGMPCYACPFERQSLAISNRTTVSRRRYTFEEDLAAVNFQPGISVDISYVTVIALKLILDLMNRAEPGYIPRLLGHLSQFTLICNTNNPELGGEQVEIFSYPLQVTTSLKVNYQAPCPPCKYL